MSEGCATRGWRDRARNMLRSARALVTKCLMMPGTEQHLSLHFITYWHREAGMYPLIAVDVLGDVADMVRRRMAEKGWIRKQLADNAAVSDGVIGKVLAGKP